MNHVVLWNNLKMMTWVDIIIVHLPELKVADILKWFKGRFVSAEVSNSIGGERETNGAAGSSQLVITTMYLFPSVITM